MPSEHPSQTDSVPHEYSDFYTRIEDLLNRWQNDVSPSDGPLLDELTGLARQAFERAFAFSPAPQRIVDPAVAGRQLTAALGYQDVHRDQEHGQTVYRTVSPAIIEDAHAAGPRLQGLWTIALKAACDAIDPPPADDPYLPHDILTGSLHYAGAVALQNSDG
ncbi:hypothetical protein ACT3SZ_07690 [Corynebacterium sp. AOP40-9SA-29]|uniref:hypothetical protein n=1 Tax=Corynebacterium sp. AOP40-9SA-29 TaxID=3457677 RepID=UPI004034C518